VFNKQAVSPRQSAGSSMAGSTFSVLGSDIAIKGDISASADLHVDGRIEGDVTCTSLVQGESSEIVGAVKAESARLAGTLRGTISARELVVLKTARIHGDVHYDALTIEQGAQVDGRFAPRAAVVLGSEEPKLILAS
jgi:cytoskeletal protein CcmA (bactofilin family)